MERQRKRLEELIDYLKKESKDYCNLDVPDNYEEQRMILRSLMNIRMPRKINTDILSIQDDFLLEEARKKGIVELRDIQTVKEQYESKYIFADKVSIWQGDITRLKVGAIVNAANSQMLGCFVPCHKCIDNAIHSAAGMQLRQECNKLMTQKRIRYGRNYEEPTGQAMITKAYNLPANYVIHTVGPIVSYKLNDSLRNDLKNCYKNVLKCCLEHNIRSLAFCCISTGEFHFPNDEAAKIAVETVTDFLSEYTSNFDRIIFNVFKDMDRKLYEKEIK